MESAQPTCIRRFESRFETADGSSLFRRGWLPPDPQQVLIAVHGFAEHSGRYEGFGAWFAERGFAVHALDHRGHGRSAGRRNYVRRFSDFLDDLAAFEALVRSEAPGLPVVIVGHSMGGLISASYACERSPDLAGLALSGAVLMPPPGISAARLWMIRAARLMAPTLGVGSGLDGEALSRDPEVARRYFADPLVDTRMTVSLAAEMMSAAGRIHGRGGQIPTPLLLMHGQADPICPAAGSEAFHASRHVNEADVRSRLHVYPELRHEIFNEPERETVFSDLLDWLAELRVDPSTGFGADAG